MSAINRSGLRTIQTFHPSVYQLLPLTPVSHNRFATTTARALATVANGPAINSLRAQQHIRSFEPIFKSKNFIPQYRQMSAQQQQLDPFALNRDIDYRELKPITEMPSDDVLLIDVREEEEVIHSNIPSSVNIPLSKFEKVLDLHEDDFKNQMGFLKPSRNQKMVLYCRSGGRSTKALEIAKGKGYKNLRNYKGSWLDWVEKESTKD